MIDHSAHSARNTLRPCQFPTVDQVAHDLGVSTETIRRWIRQGRLTAIRIGPRRLRIDPESVAQLVNAK